MKKLTLFVVMATTITATMPACRHTNATSDNLMHEARAASFTATGNPSAPPPPTSSVFIPVSLANRMIKSYLDGMDTNDNKNEIRSWLVNADSLRYFLSLHNEKIVNLKLMLAHNTDYINAGHEGERAPAGSNALTLVIAGVDAENNYVYTDEGTVPERCQPCPEECIGSGNAASDTLVSPL